MKHIIYNSAIGMYLIVDSEHFSGCSWGAKEAAKKFDTEDECIFLINEWDYDSAKWIYIQTV